MPESREIAFDEVEAASSLLASKGSKIETRPCWQKLADGAPDRLVQLFLLIVFIWYGILSIFDVPKGNYVVGGLGIFGSLALVGAALKVDSLGYFRGFQERVETLERQTEELKSTNRKLEANVKSIKTQNDAFQSSNETLEKQTKDLQRQLGGFQDLSNLMEKHAADNHKTFDEVLDMVTDLLGKMKAENDRHARINDSMEELLEAKIRGASADRCNPEARSTSDCSPSRSREIAQSIIADAPHTPPVRTRREPARGESFSASHACPKSARSPAMQPDELEVTPNSQPSSGSLKRPAFNPEYLRQNFGREATTASSGEARYQAPSSPAQGSVPRSPVTPASSSQGTRAEPPRPQYVQAKVSSSSKLAQRGQASPRSAGSPGSPWSQLPPRQASRPRSPQPLGQGG